MAFSILACQKAGAQGAVGDDADLFTVAQWQKVGLDLAGDEVVVRLNGFEPRPSVRLAQIERLLELFTCEVAAPDEARFALFDQVLQGTECFLEWDVFRPVVGLEEVDRVDLQTLQAFLGRCQYPFGSQFASHLCRQDDVVSAVPGLEPVADGLLRCPGTVGLCRVEQGDAAVEGVVHDLEGQVLVDFTAEGSSAHAHCADGEAGFAEGAIFHGFSQVRGQDRKADGWSNGNSAFRYLTGRRGPLLYGDASILRRPRLAGAGTRGGASAIASAYPGLYDGAPTGLQTHSCSFVFICGS